MPIVCFSGNATQRPMSKVTEVNQTVRNSGARRREPHIES